MTIGKPTLDIDEIRELRVRAIDAGMGERSDFELLWIAETVLELRGERSEQLADPDGKLARRELAEKILLKLIEIAPVAFDGDKVFDTRDPNGNRLAWLIADAFLKAEREKP